MAPEHSLLIVEDDVDVAEMLEAYFRAQGYRARKVHWGEEAVRVCRETSPDLVILDIRLPDIDGYEVARRLREGRRTKDIPIIFLTEKRGRDNRLRGLALGADDYLTKPFDIQELRLRVRNALRRTGQPSLLNTVTGLPESGLVDEQLKAAAGRGDRAFLAIELAGLEAFRERYGFLAADDALRAISLMIANALREDGDPADFLGHLDTATFVVITSTSRADTLAESLHRRLSQALVYFYPLQDRPEPSQLPPEGPLALRLACLTGRVPGEAEAIREAIQQTLGA